MLGAIIAATAIGAGIKGAVSAAKSAGDKAQDHAYKLAEMKQQYSYDSALSAQAAQQDLAKQVNQQDWEKMMSDTENQRKIADMKAAGVNPALLMGGISDTAAQSGAAQANVETPQQQKTNAKQEMNAENIMALTNAIKAGVLEVATKQLSKKAKALAKNPHNKKLEKSLKKDVFNYYNIIKM